MQEDQPPVVEIQPHKLLVVYKLCILNVAPSALTINGLANYDGMILSIMVGI